MSPLSPPPSEPRPPLRPLHVGKYIPPPYAGIEAHIDTLLRALQPQAEPVLVATRGAQPPEAAGLPYRVVGVPTAGTLASVPLSPGILGAVRREFAGGRAELLHLHAPNPWGDLAALTTRRHPVVMTWHSDIVRQRRLMRLYGPLQRRTLDRVDRLVVFTPKHYESSVQLRGRGLEHKLVSIPIGIDFDRLDRRADDPVLRADIDAWAAGRPLLLTVGRHVYYKGYGFLLEALARLRSDAVLVMVGKGPLTSALQAQAAALGVDARVRFAGELSDDGLATLLRRCDVFTLPSIEPSEAFGIATAEAMSGAKPTVVCELGNGVNYLTRDGETGFAVPPRDVPALADALDRLVLDGALRARMGAAARDWVRREFSVDTMRTRTLALYRSLV
ncbi:glycosyltransferase [Piscinibacter sakaiensis]|uniref:glycosyltransferase n=1 Tax=Piscinibacter sakaiensis TaxID=1547922 RepID=UPI0018D14DDC|nr:glycosyltransferase [Piscinibacter sakaiensis]